MPNGEDSKFCAADGWIDEHVTGTLSKAVWLSVQQLSCGVRSIISYFGLDFEACAVLSVVVRRGPNIFHTNVDLLEQAMSTLLL